METPAASSSSRVTQLEEARDQLLLLLRRSEEDAQQLKAEVQARSPVCASAVGSYHGSSYAG